MINKFVLVGQLRFDPELKYTAQNLAVCSITVITTEHYNNTVKESSIKCSFFGQQAEEVSSSFYKGDVVAVEGKISSNKWVNPRSGEEQTTLQLSGQKIEKIQLSSKPEEAPAEKEPYQKQIKDFFITEASEMDNTPF